MVGNRIPLIDGLPPKIWQLTKDKSWKFEILKNDQPHEIADLP